MSRFRTILANELSHHRGASFVAVSVPIRGNDARVVPRRSENRAVPVRKQLSAHLSRVRWRNLLNKRNFKPLPWPDSQALITNHQADRGQDRPKDRGTHHHLSGVTTSIVPGQKLREPDRSTDVMILLLKNKAKELPMFPQALEKPAEPGGGRFSSR